MDGRTGYAIVMPDQTIEIRMTDQTSIFHAEIQAITQAIKETVGTRRVVLTDSVSSLTALEKLFPGKNPAIIELCNLLHAEKDDLRIVWVPSHCGITGNEKADLAAKNALNNAINDEIKTITRDWINWIKQQQLARRQQEWMSANNAMSTIKPNIRRYTSHKSLPRRSQVVLSRLRTGYTRITQSYRLQLEMQPTCENCNCPVTVAHILWECEGFAEARRKHEITASCLDDDLEQANRTISYLKEINLFFEI
jgi:ribonuclease HI